MSKKISVSDQELGFNQKLKNVKFDKIVDTSTVQKAENLVERSKDDFRKATLKDFEELKDSCAELVETSDRAFVDNIQSKAFSVKSRAATGGYPLASDVARSLFEFCEKVDEAKHNVIKVHVAALEEIFSGKFDVKDQEKTAKLLAGLNMLVQRSSK